MPKINPYLIENKKPFETVQELKNEVPSFEEFMESYENDDNLNYDDLSSWSIGEVKGYGPCRNSLCGCSCSSSVCNCSSAEISARKEADVKAGSCLAVGRVRDGKASGEVSSSVFRIEDSNKEVRLFSSSAGGEVGKSGAKVKFGTDLVSYKSDGVQVRAGVNVDTGISVDDGLEVKALGFGFSANDEQVGFSTPFGEIKVDKDKDDCLIQ